jgi:hypothetical protein
MGPMVSVRGRYWEEGVEKKREFAECRDCVFLNTSDDLPLHVPIGGHHSYKCTALSFRLVCC